MPMMRSPCSASATMARYRVSKTCSGMNTLGNSTAFGSGKSGIVGGSMEPAASMDGLGLPVHVVHQDVLPERIRRREIGLAAADGGDPPDKSHQIVVARQHE